MNMMNLLLEQIHDGKMKNVDNGLEDLDELFEEIGCRKCYNRRFKSNGL